MDLDAYNYDWEAALNKAQWCVVFSMTMLLSFTSGCTLTLLLHGSELETWAFPVSRDWMVTEWHNDGNDVIVVGTFRKTRSCSYIPPPRVLSVAAGEPMLVRSESRTPVFSMPASQDLRKFGPWRVIDGANQKLLFHQEHECHPLWNVFTNLGSFDPKTWRAP